MGVNKKSIYKRENFIFANICEMFVHTCMHLPSSTTSLVIEHIYDHALCKRAVMVQTMYLSSKSFICIKS